MLFVTVYIKVLVKLCSILNIFAADFQELIKKKKSGAEFQTCC